MIFTKAQLLSLLAFTLAIVAMVVPASAGIYGERFQAAWMWGLYFDAKDGEFGFGGGESYFAALTPVFIVTVALGVGHLIHSLVSKTADKWLNRMAGGVLFFFTAFAYLIGMYIGSGFWIVTNVPIGLSIEAVAGLFGLWSANLTRQEKIPERQTPKEGM